MSLRSIRATLSRDNLKAERIGVEFHRSARVMFGLQNSRDVSASYRRIYRVDPSFGLRMSGGVHNLASVMV
jgi:hypothetical protein